MKLRKVSVILIIFGLTYWDWITQKAQLPYKESNFYTHHSGVKSLMLGLKSTKVSWTVFSVLTSKS